MDTTYWQKKLEAEKATVEQELQSVGRINPQNPTDWEVTPLKEGGADFRDEVASHLEDMQERSQIESTLEVRLTNINKALDRIRQGTFGKCTVCQQAIETDRLEANPAATTCKAHLAEANGTS